MGRRVVTTGLTLLGGVIATQVGWSLVELVAAARLPPQDDGPARGQVRFRILIPAHDEERMLPATLESLAATDYPPEQVDVVVIADHCSDGTAAVARRAGARVLERDEGPGGKGAALAWGLQHGGPPVDAVVIVDADCLVSPNLLAAAERHLLAGRRVVQVDYTVANPGASAALRLRWVALRLINTVRPRGRTALGLSSGLNGTGMIFAAEVLEQYGWPTHSLIEDREQHLVLLCNGISTGFAPEAWVTSDMPTGAAGEHTQHQRWESGRWTLWREWAPRLARRAIGHRDPVAAGALMDLLTLPQAVLVAGSGLVVAGGLVLRAPGVTALGAAALAGQAGFVLGGLTVVGAPPEAYRSLLTAPRLVAEKLRVLVEVAVGAAPRSFVRTARD